MKKTLNKFARLTLLDYKLPMNLVDDCFIAKTKEIIKTLEEDKMCYNFSLTTRRKDEKNSNYAELYHKKIEEIKKKLLNIVNGSILKNCLAYNNRFLFLRLSELPLMKDKQKINNFFKSINAYLNRIAFNPTYGGLMGFYSRISLKKNCLKADRLSLKILEQPNGLMQKNVNPKIVCFNPTIFSKKNEILFFRFKDDFEEIVKINNFSNIALAKEIKKIKGLQRLLDIDLASNSHFDIYKNCFNASSRPTRYDLVRKNNFKIKKGFVYDVINTDTITVHKRIDDNFKLAASTCLNYLKKQLSDLHNEKNVLGKILADHLKDIGGGSLESLIAFNNEKLVREVVSFPVPVIAAIGHHKDMPLVAMAADIEVSTPTAAAVTLNSSWIKAITLLDKYQTNIFNNYQNVLRDTRDLISKALEGVRKYANSVFNKYKKIENDLKVSFQNFKNALLNVKSELNNLLNKSLSEFRMLLSGANQQLEHAEQIISSNNPERQLSLGYSIARYKGKIIRKVKDVAMGENIDLNVTDGVITSEVKNINKN